jgi:hypothetical protein
MGRGGGRLPHDARPAIRSQFFTVRCWYEAFDGGRGEWRGEVRHSATDRRAYFREWDKLVGFLQQVLEESQRGAGPEGPR